MHYFCYHSGVAAVIHSWSGRGNSGASHRFTIERRRSVNKVFTRGASDLQFVPHHVEGVVGKVDLLDAVDDLLLRLRVDGLLPQLP